MSKSAALGLLVKMAFLLYFILQAHFLQIDKMGLIVQIINKSTKINKAQELQICSKQASIHEKMQFIVQLIEMMSTPTNKLATYFGDDKPTSRSKVKCKSLLKLIEILWKLSLLSVE